MKFMNDCYHKLSDDPKVYYCLICKISMLCQYCSIYTLHFYYDPMCSRKLIVLMSSLHLYFTTRMMAINESRKEGVNLA